MTEAVLLELWQAEAMREAVALAETEGEGETEGEREGVALVKALGMICCAEHWRAQSANTARSIGTVRGRELIVQCVWGTLQQQMLKPTGPNLKYKS